MDSARTLPIAGVAETAEQNAAGWAKFTTPRPFKRCAVCTVDLVPSYPGSLCPRCELAAKKGPMQGPANTPHNPGAQAGPGNMPGPRDESASDYDI